MTEYKKINIQNWLKLDLKGTFNGTAEMWLDFHLRSRLAPEVPEQVGTLFEVARGSMIYGCFFFPLLTLASEQCHRVLEAAAKIRCEQLKIPLEIKRNNGKVYPKRYTEIVEDLVQHGNIEKNDKIKWDAGRSMRNQTSHPDSQILLVPGMTITILDTTVELINKLYSAC